MHLKGAEAADRDDRRSLWPESEPKRARVTSHVLMSFRFDCQQLVFVTQNLSLIFHEQNSELSMVRMLSTIDYRLSIA